MKIFDFSNGKKGELLGAVQRCDQTGGWLVKKGDKTFKVTLTKTHGPSNEEWTWQTDAARFDHDSGTLVSIKPEDFGVGAICFCFGEMRFGSQDNNGIWAWHVVGTQEWNRNACKNKILKAEVVA